jgi:hypothetical protein
VTRSRFLLGYVSSRPPPEAICERLVKHWRRLVPVYDFQMQSIACAIALLLLNSAIFAQSGAAPNMAGDIEHEPANYRPWTHVLEDGPQEEYWFEGTIRNSTVRMYLHRGGAGVVGLFYATDGEWKPTFLGGEWSADKITLSAESADQAPKGHLRGQLVNGAFIGNWTPDSSRHVDPVRLAAIQKPACDGRGVWKRLDDLKWPVSFSYPASWHIQEDRDALRLICPDPEAMTSEDEVTIYEGKGKPGGPWRLVHSDKGWRHDLDEGNSASFSVSKVSQQLGKTILNLDHEWRVYCTDGGYVGLGEGEDQVVLLRDYWIEFMGAGSASDIVDRLVKSTSARAAHNTQ